MTDFTAIFDLVQSSDKLQSELTDRFSSMHGNGLTGMLSQIKDNLLRHYTRHHPTPLVVETDARGIIISINDAYLAVSKYTREELLGQNISILRSSQTDPGLFTDLWNHISAGKPWIGELRNITKDYEPFAIDLLIIPVPGPEAKPERYWSVAFDVSEQLKKQDELNDKNKGIEESIQYAKRIQKTILPEKSLLDQIPGTHFVMFKPKDIVSGDFYWLARNIRTVFVAVVDCTGHGVPGAFMSLIGFNLLNQIVNEQKKDKPGDILSELHRMVRSTLKQDASDSKSRDGMDVCMVALDLYDDSFQYAGANRPLFYHHKGELQEIKPDKHSIGGEQMEEERIFTNHIIEGVEDGDSIYLVSDGFIDQFGGPEEKKFSTKRFKQLIQDNCHEPMSVQRAMFNLAWKDWKGDGEQIDDVTLIGIRFGDAK